MTELDKRYLLTSLRGDIPFTIAGISGSCEIFEGGTIFAYHLAGIDL